MKVFCCRFISSTVELSADGIERWIGLPKMSERETTDVNVALIELERKLRYVQDWYCKYMGSTVRFDACQHQFFTGEKYDDCAYSAVN